MSEKEKLEGVEEVKETEEIEAEEVVEEKPKDKKGKNVSKDEIESLYAFYEKHKSNSKDEQVLAKEFKDQIIEIMNEKGYDEIIIDGLDSLVKLSITYPEREVLNKKALAEALGIKQKELSKPEVIIELTNKGLITTEMIEQFTEVEERMQFSAEEYDPNQE